MHLNLLFVLSLILCTSILRSENIVVTNTSDNGTGSLRWAIERANANGTAVGDVILFNLPLVDFNDHIILLNTELPALTSNITIDGTTQPGQSFGLTDAKVTIKQDHYAPFFSMLTISNAKNVNIYGLHLYMGYRDGMFNPPARSNSLYGINISNSFDIQIGAPGKGNVINGAQYAIFSQSDSCKNINIKSNFIGQRAYFNVGSNPVTGTDIDYPSVVGCEYAIFYGMSGTSLLVVRMLMRGMCLQPIQV